MLKLHELLKSINNSPQAYVDDKEWLSILATQRSLAEYSNPQLGIRACAMATFRSSASRLVIGFDGINNLRISARAKLLQLAAQKPKKAQRSRRDYVSEIALLKQQLKTMSRDFCQMEIVVYKLRLISEHLATDEGIRDRKKWWLREMREVEIIYEGGVGRLWIEPKSAI
ncbi:hypothetical protein [Pseudomonas putida]|uniref:hypothetical protein n=1 Tax=Pseudomonas putida TaxID=303 RepID=UPI0012601448|nr:hypothetical protein [Pseudomonas putida]